MAQKIPYEILGSFKFIEREEIKDVLAFLRTIIYQDNLSLLRILSLQEKIGVRAIERIEQKSEKENLSIYKYLDKFVLKQEKLTTGQDEKIGTLILKIDDYKKKLLKQKGFLYNFLIEVLNDFSY